MADLADKQVGIVILGGNATLDTLRSALTDDRW